VVCKHLGPAVFLDEQNVVRFALGALLHPRRADRHAGDRKANGVGTLCYEPLDIGRGHMALDDIAVDLGGMA
jgi:hypothetical protein